MPTSAWRLYSALTDRLIAQSLVLESPMTHTASLEEKEPLTTPCHWQQHESMNTSWRVYCLLGLCKDFPMATLLCSGFEMSPTLIW